MVYFGKGFTKTSHGRISPVQFMILLILGKNNTYGYKLLQELSGIFSGVWKPTSGTVYPAMKSLERRGFLESEKVEQEDKPDKKIYKITEKGRDILKEIFESFEEEIEFSEEYGSRLFKYMEHNFERKRGFIFSKLFLHDGMDDINHWKHHRGSRMKLWLMPWMKYLFSDKEFPDDNRKEILKQYKAQLQKELENINKKLEKIENKEKL